MSDPFTESMEAARKAFMMSDPDLAQRLREWVAFRERQGRAGQFIEDVRAAADHIDGGAE